MTRRQQGFTMIELLVVVAVIGVMAAVSVVGFGSFSESTGLKATAKQLNADFWAARQKAIAGSVPYSILFNMENNSYTVFKDDGSGTPSNSGNGEIDTGEEIVRTTQLGDDFFLYYVNLDPANVVIFFPRGTLKDGTTGGYVEISNSDFQRKRRISITASGQTRVE
jgi:type II secretion system protein H